MNKQKVWQELQRREPALAEILKQHTATFGKPESVKVTYRKVDNEAA